MARRRRPKSRILLPGERESRRGFLKLGLVGAALIAAAAAFHLSDHTTGRASGVVVEARALVRKVRELVTRVNASPADAATAVEAPARAGEPAAPPAPPPPIDREPPRPLQASSTGPVAAPAADGAAPARRRASTRGDTATSQTARPRPAMRSAPLRPKPVEIEAVDHAGLEPPAGGKTAGE